MMQASLPHIIEQHAEEAAFLWLLRDNAVTEAHYNLTHLQELEERIEAHIDGLRIAGDEGWKCCLENLRQFPESGEMFAATILALESNHNEYLQQLYTLAETNHSTERGLISALAWVDSRHLQSKVSDILNAKNTFLQRIGISTCAIRRVNPRQYLELAIKSQNTQLCCRALKAAGELARNDLSNLITHYLTSDNVCIRFWAAWSLTLLGNRNKALHTLKSFLLPSSDYAFKAAQLLLRDHELKETQRLLGQLIKQPNNLRLTIQGSGMSGDARYIPWLIEQMNTPAQARVAGEAFSLITGIDLAYNDLETDQPSNFHVGPTESAQDPNTQLDPDENLPWPDAELIKLWWQQHKNELPLGQRYLMGKPISVEQCRIVLKTAMQRQRHAAALELALMKPETILFETRAKAELQIKST